LRQPQLRKACCAALAAGTTVSVARSSGRPDNTRPCRTAAMPWRAPGRAHQQAGQCEGTARVLGGDFLRQRGGQAAPPVGRGAQRHPGRVSGHVTAWRASARTKPGWRRRTANRAANWPTSSSRRYSARRTPQRADPGIPRRAWQPASRRAGSSSAPTRGRTGTASCAAAPSATPRSSTSTSTWPPPSSLSVS
jgi:hypothetical protein